MKRTISIAGFRHTAIFLITSFVLTPQTLFAADEAEQNPFNEAIDAKGDHAETPALYTLAQEEVQEEEESLWDKTKRGVNDLMNHESTQKAIETGGAAVESSKNAVQRFVGKKTSRSNRQETDYSLFYIPMNYGIIMPTKTGFAGSWMINGEWTLEGEYLDGGYSLGFLGIDLFDLSERIIGLNTRWYPGNSFNLKFGVAERKYNFSLGSDYLNRITGGDVAETKFLEVKNEVLLLGLGNRWQYDSGFTFGFDWFELIVPVGKASVKENFLHTVKNQSDRNDIQDVIDYMRTGTTFNAIKLHVGYAF